MGAVGRVAWFTVCVIATVSVVLAGTVVSSLAIGWLYGGLSMPCENTPLSEVPSPDGRLKLVIFERSCGATTDFTTQASLSDRHGKPDDEAGNIFIADADHGRAPRAAHGGPELHALWLDETTLQLTHDARARVFQARAELGDVGIVYVRTESSPEMHQ